MDYTKRPYSLKASDWLIIAISSMVLFATLTGIAIWLSLDSLQKEFQQTSRVAQTTLIQRLNNIDAALIALVGQYHSYKSQPERLTAFSHDLIQQFGFVRSVMLAQQLPASERQTYETEIQSHGFREFTLKDALDNEFIPAKQRDIYYPLHHIEPVTPWHINLTGLDLMSIPDLQPLLNRTLESNRINSSIAFHLLEENDISYFIAKTIYTNAYILDSLSISKQNISGIALIQLDPNRLLPEISTDSHYSLRLDSELHDQPILITGTTSSWSILPNFSSTRVLPAHDQEWQLSLSYQTNWTDFNNRSLAAALGMALLLSAGFGIGYRMLRLSRLEHQYAREQLFEQREKARVTLESIADAVITTDILGRIDFINTAAEDLLGIDAKSVQGKTFLQACALVDESDIDLSRDPVKLCLASHDGRFQSDTHLLLRHDGNHLSLHTSASAIHDTHGHISGVVLVLRDNSKTRRLVKKIAWEATHDPLTGLINRRGFEQTLGETLDIFHTEGGQFVFCYLDLDEFKPVNDTCGHQAGDELLKLIATNLKQHIRRNDVLARLGGDEFGLLLNDCPLERASEIAEKIREDTYNLQFYWDSKVFNVSVSIGMAVIRDNMQTINDVLNAADNACYMAKDKGRNQICLYRSNKSETPETGTTHWPDRIRKALSEHDFVLVTQRIQPLVTRESTPPMVEFLLRLKQPDGTLVPPMAFIPAAERNNLMYDIDRWVIDHALREMSHQNSNNNTIYTLNISGQSLDHAELSRYIVQRIAEYGINPQQLCIEISASDALSHLDEALRFINNLKKLGCHFSLDDFGAGISSFSHLKKLPVDIIKIDGAFIRNLQKDKIDKSLVRTITHVGHVLNLKIIAEWVENAATLKMLEELGVDYAQGFVFGAPQPSENHIQH